MKTKKQAEELTLRNVNPDGSVLAMHSWATGWQALTFGNRALFDAAAKKLRDGGSLGYISGVSVN